MNEPELLRIRQIRVDGLFGLYNHTINLNQEERVTVLHGPNGVGKTITLKMVHALLEGQFSFLGEIPFSCFSVSFTDGASIKVAPVLKPNSQLDKLRGKGNAGRQPKKLKISLNNKEASYEFPVGRDMIFVADEISEHIHWLHRAGENLWIDERDGEELRADEIVSRYSSYSFSNIKKQGIGQEPAWLSQLRNKVNTYLIEAQRLLRVQEVKSPHFRPSSEMVSTVVDYAQEIKQRIRETLARYGQQSQTLDQSFPQRLLAVAGAPFESSELKKRMGILDAKRDELKRIGLLDDSEIVEHSFNPSQLDDLDYTKQRVMTLYVQDTEQKLGVFDELAHPARLFLDNVNKFQHKRLRLDREKGFIVEDENRQPLDINLLSSGEQHELVLNYDLLFRVRKNTLVLIDEPELSLHVAWQKRFLPDLLEIVKIAQIDALVATHSPFIVGDRTDLMVPLEAELADVSV